MIPASGAFRPLSLSNLSQRLSETEDGLNAGDRGQTGARVCPLQTVQTTQTDREVSAQVIFVETIPTGGVTVLALPHRTQERTSTITVSKSDDLTSVQQTIIGHFPVDLISIYF